MQADIDTHESQSWRFGYSLGSFPVGIVVVDKYLMCQVGHHFVCGFSSGPGGSSLNMHSLNIDLGILYYLNSGDNTRRHLQKKSLNRKTSWNRNSARQYQSTFYFRSSKTRPLWMTASRNLSRSLIIDGPPFGSFTRDNPTLPAAGASIAKTPCSATLINPCCRYFRRPSMKHGGRQCSRSAVTRLHHVG